MNSRDRFSPARLLHLILLFSAFFGLLVIRLYRLQVTQAEVYLKQSETNRVRIVEVPPLRGLMYDREGRLIVDNSPSYTLLATPNAVDGNPAVRDTLLRITGLDSVDFEKRLRRIPGNLYTPVRIMRDVPFRLYAALEERRAHLPGVSFQVEPKRAYLYEVAPHTLGYIGELKEVDKKRYPGREPGDMVGLSGLEKTWNDPLSGEPGYDYFEVDVMGRVVGPLQGVEPIPPEPGKDLVLTIDLDLQLLAEDLLADKAGAVVCIEPATGEVLAIVSKPDYPPETFANVLTPAQWNRLQEDPAKPLLHRAVQGTYPPGSVFKMAVLSAALESGTIDRSFSVTCAGGVQLGQRWFGCWNKAGHGKVDQEMSIEASCDVFFYTIGSMLGIDRFHEYISRFPFGRRTGIDLDNEAQGLLPDRAFFDRRFGKDKWSKGLLFNIAIGQGEVLVTPLQAAVYTTALANGGWWITPHLVKELRGEGEAVEAVSGPERFETGFSASVMKTVREDMLQVTEGRHGTAAWLYDPRMHVAGKTGTAQNPHGKDHALFVAFAPFENPTIAVAVVVEHGEHGSTAAAPIAFKLIRRYLGLDEEGWRLYRAKVLAGIAEANRNASADSGAPRE